VVSYPVPCRNNSNEHLHRKQNSTFGGVSFMEIVPIMLEGKSACAIPLKPFFFSRFVSFQQKQQSHCSYAC